jgi:hypothetical protein
MPPDDPVEATLWECERSEHKRPGLNLTVKGNLICCRNNGSRACRLVRFIETPLIISVLEMEGAFDDSRSAGDPSLASGTPACINIWKCEQAMPTLWYRSSQLLPMASCPSGRWPETAANGSS